MPPSKISKGVEKPERWKYDRLVTEQDDQDDDPSAAVDAFELDTVAKSEDTEALLHSGLGGRADSKTGTHKPNPSTSIDIGPSPLHRRNSSDSMSQSSSLEIYGFKRDEPTAHELRTLRRIPDKLPWSAFLVAIVELCERFAYYGLSGPFQNYISNSYKGGSNPGALGRGQVGATALTNAFNFWCYFTPIIGAIVADQYLGKYKTIVLFAGFYMIGLVVLFVTSLPVSIEGGVAFPGLIVAMIIIGLGTGGIKSNVSPLIAEQVQETRTRTKYLASGEKIIVDPTLTVQRIYMIFYLCINVGSLSSIATTEMELHIGFWSSYLLALCMFVVGFIVLVAGRKQYVVRPPQGSVIAHSIKAIIMGVKSKNGLDGAKPSIRRDLGLPHNVPWDDSFVDELKRALIACKVFLFFPIYWVVYNQMMNNFVSQAGTMELHGLPNDIMQNIDPLTVILFIPICDRLVYPFLRKMGIAFKPITRIFWGFMMGAIAMGYAAYVQHLIYAAPPCYNQPLKCTAAKLADNGIQHNKVHIAVQTPAYVFIALSEIFASITGLEYAYTKAPASMKSLIMSLFLLTNAFGALLGAAIAPAAHDPNLEWLYIGLAVFSLVGGCVFWILYSRYNRVEDVLNELKSGSDGDYEVAPTLPMPNRVSKLELGPMFKRSSTRPGTRQ